MFNHDEEKIINNFPSFQDHQSGEIIYIPYLEPFINRYYANDYQLVTLKQHQVYLNSYAKTIDKVIELYGIQPYNSQFSSLHWLVKMMKVIIFIMMILKRYINLMDKIIVLQMKLI
ncbi:MAG: hypothetical protein ACLS85_06105 [Coprobacillus cateniformis]